MINYYKKIANFKGDITNYCTAKTTIQNNKFAPQVIKTRDANKYVTKKEVGL